MVLFRREEQRSDRWGYLQAAFREFEAQMDVTQQAVQILKAKTGKSDPREILALAMTEDALEVEPAGELSLKGVQRPVPAFNVVGIKA